MKQIKMIFAAATLSAIFLTSCSKDNDAVTETPAPAASTGDKLNKTETCPKIGITIESFEKSGGLAIKTVGSSDAEGSIYTWTVTTSMSSKVIKTFKSNELNWVPEIGATTFELLVTTKDCPTGIKIAKTFTRTFEEVAVAGTPADKACPKVDLKILTSKEVPVLGSSIRVDAIISGGTNALYSWEVLLDGVWYKIREPGSKSNSIGYSTPIPGISFRVFVTTDECPAGVTAIINY